MTSRENSSQTHQPRHDPLIDEVREIRRGITQQCGEDIERMIERLRLVERQYAGRVVQPPPNVRPGRVA